MADGFYYRKGFELQWSVPVGSGVVIASGDLLKISSGKAVLMASGGDNLDFIGPAKSSHGAADGSGTVQVWIPLPTMVFEYPLDTATTIVIGDALAWSAAQVLTKNTTNPIATAVEAGLSKTTVRCVFRMPAATATNIRLGTGDAS